jgi:peptidoglycan/LPS O-acetylase OafA/YrhL
MAAPLPPFSFVWWSLATEAQFYVLLPLLPWLLTARRGRGIAVAAGVLYAAAYIAFACGRLHLATLPGNNRLVHSFIGRLPLFAYGILAAGVYERYGDIFRRWAARTPWMRWGGDVVCIAALVLLGSLLRQVVYVNYFELETHYPEWHLLEGACWTTVLLLLVLAPLRLKSLLSNRVLATLGTLSYSIYLVHVPVLTFGLAAIRARWTFAAAGWDAPAFAAVALLLACVGAISAATYHVIERPMLERKARLRAHGPADHGYAAVGALPTHPPPVQVRLRA